MVSYLINDHIVLFDRGLCALVEILCKCIHNAMQELNYKQWWYYREEQEEDGKKLLKYCIISYNIVINSKSYTFRNRYLGKVYCRPQ